MLKIEPIASDENALEQLCDSVARIEDGIGHINQLLISVTAPPTAPPLKLDTLPLAVLIHKLVTTIATARSKYAGTVEVSIADAERALEYLVELRRRK